MRELVFWPVLLTTGLVLLPVLALLGVEAVDLVAEVGAEHAPLRLVLLFWPLWAPLVVASGLLLLGELAARRRRVSAGSSGGPR